jgi:hypothetical protein
LIRRAFSANEDVVLKFSFFYGSIWESHLAIAMLDALLPLALINGTIGPEHFTIPITLIVKVAASVYVTALPSEYAIAVFAILCVLTIILVARCHILLFLPFAFAMLKALLELTHIDTA